MTLASAAERAATGIGSLVGAPQRAAMPAGYPVSVFVCPVRLVEGCLPPPGPIACRIGAGAALDDATARQLCLLEGVERHGLQYRRQDPPQMASVAFAGARRITRAVGDLRLGCSLPGRSDRPADSRGCAAGIDLADAALRGLAELVEHEVLDHWEAGTGDFGEIDPDALPALDRLGVWMRAARLELRLFAAAHPSGLAACIAVCLEPGGRHAATGSAAALTAGEAAVHAAVESVLAWANYAAIARSGSGLDHLPEADRRAIRRYDEGVLDLPARPRDVQPVREPARDGRPDRTEDLFAAIVRRWNVPVAVFDLTRPETGLAIARVVRL